MFQTSNKKLKLLVVTPTFPPFVGGAEMGIYEICRRLAKKYEVKVLTPYPRQKVMSQMTEDPYYMPKDFTVEKYHNRVDIRRIPIINRFAPPVSLSSTFAVIKEIRSYQPDIINFQYLPPNGLSIILVKFFTKIPIILSLVSRMDVFREENESFKKHSIYYRFAIRFSSHVVSNSRYYTRQIPHGVSQSIIPYGVDKKRFMDNVCFNNRRGEELKRKLNIKENTKVLFSLQRLAAVKNVDFIIYSFSELLLSLNEVVLVIGGKGSEEEKLKKLVKRLDLEDKVIFAGYIDENALPFYFAMSDIFVFASTDETFGVVLAQALSTGTPVISLSRMAIPEVIDDHKNGILLQEMDTKLFAQEINGLLQDNQKHKKFSDNARLKAKKRYNWNRIADKYEALINRLNHRK